MERRFSLMDADGLFFNVAEDFTFDHRVRAKVEQESGFNPGGFPVIEQRASFSGIKFFLTELVINLVENFNDF